MFYLVKFPWIKSQHSVNVQHLEDNSFKRKKKKKKDLHNLGVFSPPCQTFI